MKKHYTDFSGFWVFRRKSDAQVDADALAGLILDRALGFVSLRVAPIVFCFFSVGASWARGPIRKSDESVGWSHRCSGRFGVDHSWRGVPLAATPTIH